MQPSGCAGRSLPPLPRKPEAHFLVFGALLSGCSFCRARSGGGPKAQHARPAVPRNRARLRLLALAGLGWTSKKLRVVPARLGCRTVLTARHGEITNNLAPRHAGKCNDNLPRQDISKRHLLKSRELQPESPKPQKLFSKKEQPIAVANPPATRQ